MKWWDCPDVEREAEKVSGAWVVKGSRVKADAILDNSRDGFSPDAIASMFEGLSVEQVRAVLRFAGIRVSYPA